MAGFSYVATFFLFLTKLCIGQREVTVQKGPLFRAQGYPVSIGCKVTGHRGPSEQHFQWSIYLPSAPTQEVQIVSTKDADFSYAMYAQRVRNGEIYVERVQGNSVLLHISELQMKDAGEYECHTPNTDGKYYGSYSAKTKLIDFMLIPGPLYTERFAAGDVRFSKLGATTFTLSIERLQPSDQGQLFCEAVEWIQDPDETWTFITKKQTDQTTLRIQPADLKPTARSVVMSTKNKQQAVWEGEALILLCKVGGPESPLAVNWSHIPQDQTQPEFVAGMGQDGIVQLGASDGRASYHGNIRLEKVDWATFRMEITSTTLTDSGTYECRVSQRTRNKARDLSWTQKISVAIKSLESSLQVSLMSRQPQVKLANTFDLSCIVRAGYSDLKLPLTVTWQFQPAGAQDFYQLIRITHNGTIEWGDFLSQFQKKTKVSQSSFHSKLLIHDATEEETGVYRCKAEVYDRNSLHTNGPARASVISHPLKIAITLPESKLEVNSSSQVQEISINSNTDIECSIVSRSTGNLPLAIIWYFSPISTSASWLRILEMDQTNVVKYGDEFHTPRRKQKFHTEKVSQDLFQLHILNVEGSDQGKYHCAVEEWLLSTNGTWLKLGGKKSGLTELKLKPTGSKVHVSKVYRTENVTEQGEVTIHCSLESLGSSASLYSVMWYWNRENSGNKLLVHLRHDGLLEYGEEGLRGHLHCYRTSPADFVLQLRHVRMEDAGMYWCTVTEWQLHGHPSKWVNHASDESQRMVLTVLPSGT
ncbi:PREDICTED: immunoglobulin superfamily member 2 [Propithecus coquereli]|uniref:immunoglobulin superfamily member 2 n=1 Tax=Propithecus coquereli TaxID=379532 RepID=UPI00063EE709|nr:PREDICTED: immunoglobulin superfamily member 2 [Propithecus coquereli]